MAHFIVAIWSHGPFLSRWKIGSHLCRLDGFFASREANETLIKAIEVQAHTCGVSCAGSVVTKTTLNWPAVAGGNFRSASAIIYICSGHMSGQWVYPKNRNVTYPRVSASKSNVVPEVSVSVNFGLGSGGETNPP